MKKITILAIMALLAAGCGANAQKDIQKDEAEISEKLDELYQQYEDGTVSAEEADAIAKDVYEKAFRKHRNDSLGLSLFIPLITSYWSAEEALAEFEKAGKIIKNDALAKTKMESIKHVIDVEPGKPYIEISGPDAISGATLCIGDVLAEGKPVLVDFWASWCGPCRDEIKERLLDLNESGKVNIIGIAVWEKSVENTRKAMEELGITWPVIYTGGRENSPSIQYGVLGIPTVFLLSPDGTILDSSHSVDGMDFFKE